MKKILSAALSAVMALQLAAVPYVFHNSAVAANAATTRIDSSGRIMEKLNRGVHAVSTGKAVFVSWRSLEEDPVNAAFNVYRTTDGKETKLNAEPLTGGTNYTDTTANLSKNNTYTVKMVVNGKEVDSGSGDIAANSTANATIVPIKPGGMIHFIWVGDFNGDGTYDFLVDRCVDDHQKLEAYLSDGTYLWTLDMGVNSENKNNISPGPSTIDVGMWDGATVYDIDNDGIAEVLVRIADGVVFGDGNKFSNNSGGSGQAIAVLDGKTGALKSSVNLPQDYMNIGPMACMMEVGYLDGKNPSLVCWLKNRNPNKSFNSLMVAYKWDNGKLVQQWKFDNKKYYAEAHQIRIADVDYDGKDEVLHMGYALNGDGSLKYVVPEVVHGDRWFVGCFNPDDEGKAMMGYGIQQNHEGGLLEYYYNAATGKLIWKNQTTDGSTYDVGRGNVGDIDPTHPGFECFSFQGTWSSDGKKICNEYMYPCLRLWWDGDVLSEQYNDGKIEKWDYNYHTTNRLATSWKITDCTGSDRGAPMFYGDILGDWREEVVMTSYAYDKIVILSTTTPTDIRNECLAQDPCYRNCMTAKGYYQSHMLDYYLGDGMKEPVKVTTKPGAEIDTTNKYQIKNLNSGMYLVVEGAKAEKTANVVQSAEPQTWTLESVGDGYYQFYSQVGDGKSYVIDVYGEKTEDGSNISIYTNGKSDAHAFKLVDNGNGTYTITTKITDDVSCLGVDNMSKEEGANVLEWSSNGSADQSWILEKYIEPIHGTLIKELHAQDVNNYQNWKIAENAQIGSAMFGDRDITYAQLPNELKGAEFVQTACDSKKTDSDLATITLSENGSIYVALDTRVEKAPAWLNNWTKTDLTISSSNDVILTLYRKDVKADEEVLLGTNGMSGSVVNYTVFATPESKIVIGDVNADGIFDAADCVMMQKWLLAVPGATLTDWKAGDLCEDGRIDVFDLTMMKRLLVENHYLQLKDWTKI